MPDPQHTFSVENGFLVCITKATGGTSTTHRCSMMTCQLLAFEMHEFGTKGFTADSLVKHMKAVLDMNVAPDEVTIVLAFLTAQQCVESAGRDGKKHRPAGAFLFDDAMEEYHLLRQRGQPG